MSWRTRRLVTGLPQLYRGLPLGGVAACTDRVASHVACCSARCIAARLRTLLCIVSQASLTVSRARPVVSWLCPAMSCLPLDAPRPTCLISLLCACSACCVPAQPIVFLLSLLCAYLACCVPNQPAMCLLGLLCACSACCVPQYN